MKGLDNWHINGYNIAISHNLGRVAMIIRTRIFRFCDGSYKNLSELAQAMGISVSQIYRVREGKRNINQKFIIGAIRAFPRHKFEDLFYLAPERPTVTNYYRQDSIEEQTAKEKTEHTERALEKLASVPL